MTWAFRRRCPHCKETRFARSHRHGLFERFISILFLPYRCDECDRRFFGYRGWVRPGEGLGIHRFGLALSGLVIIASALSVIHSRQAERPSARGTEIEPPPVTEQVDTAPIPPVQAERAPAAKPAPARRKKVVSSAAAHPSAPGGGVRLRSRNSVVIVASNESAAQAIRRRTQRIEDLIHGGAVFSISNGTAATVESQQDGVAKVRILQGAMAGKRGWVPAGEISTK